MISAPDVVVALLGGPFEKVQTMAEVPRDRVVGSALEYRHWTPKTHRHLCSPAQQRCACAVLFVARRLQFKAAAAGGGHRRSGWQASVSAALPALPDVLWFAILGWLRREELGKDST